jgi:hypothetical protein
MQLQNALELISNVENADMLDNEDNAEFRKGLTPDQLYVLRLHYQLDHYFLIAIRKPGVIPSIDYIRFEIEIATAIYDEIHRIDPEYTPTTDFDCTYGSMGSPWVESVATPEEFVFMCLSFDCECDERTYDATCEPEIRELAATAAELNFTTMRDDPERFFPVDEDDCDPAIIRRFVQEAFEKAA